jgi:hypothetical protein
VVQGFKDLRRQGAKGLHIAREPEGEKGFETF